MTKKDVSVRIEPTNIFSFLTDDLIKILNQLDVKTYGVD